MKGDEKYKYQTNQQLIDDVVEDLKGSCGCLIMAGILFIILFIAFKIY